MKHAWVVVLLFACSKSEQAAFDESKVDLAKLQLKKLALEAYPQWAMSNPAKACPDTLAELGEFMSDKSLATTDPWKNPLKMYCGENLPQGAKGLAVISSGPDGKAGTADDVKSWE